MEQTNNLTNFNQNYYAVKAYENVTNEITKCVGKVMENYLKIGVLLLRMREEKIYEIAGYNSLDEYAQTEFNFSRTLVNNVINVALRFAKRDDSNNYLTELDDKYSEFSFSQLVELLPVKNIDVDQIKPSMSIKEIRIQKARSKISDEINEFNDKVKEDLLQLIDERITKNETYYSEGIPWNLTSEFDNDGYATYIVKLGKEIEFHCICYYSKNDGNSVLYSSYNSPRYGNHSCADGNEMIDFILKAYDEFRTYRLDVKAEKLRKEYKAEKLERDYKNISSCYELPNFVSSKLATDFKNRGIIIDHFTQNVIDLLSYFPSWTENSRRCCIRCSVYKTDYGIEVELKDLRFYFNEENIILFSRPEKESPDVAIDNVKKSFSSFVIKMKGVQVKFVEFYMYGFIGCLKRHFGKELINEYFGFNDGDDEKEFKDVE